MADTLLALACPGSAAEPRSETNRTAQITSPSSPLCAAPPATATGFAAAAPAARYSPIPAPPASLAAVTASLEARSKVMQTSGMLSSLPLAGTLPMNLPPSFLAEIAGVANGQAVTTATTAAVANAATVGGGFSAAGASGGGEMRMEDAIMVLQPLVRVGMQQQQQAQAAQAAHAVQAVRAQGAAQATQVAHAAQAQAQALLPTLLQQYASLPSFFDLKPQNAASASAAAVAAALHGARHDVARENGPTAAAFQQALLRDIARATAAASGAAIAGAAAANATLIPTPISGGSAGRDLGMRGAAEAGAPAAINAAAADCKLAVGFGASPRTVDFNGEDFSRRRTPHDDAAANADRRFELADRRTRDYQHPATAAAAEGTARAADGDGGSSGDSNIETCPGQQQRRAGVGICSPGGPGGGSSGDGGKASRGGLVGMKRSAGAMGSGLDLDGLGGDNGEENGRSVRPRTVAERKRRNNISHRLEQLKEAIPLCNPRITTEALLCETLTYIDALKAKIRNLQSEKANLLEHVLTL